MVKEHSDKDISHLVHYLIGKNIGSTDALSERIRSEIHDTYSQFLEAYLGFLRLKYQQPLDWLPDRLQLDNTLVDDMRHFFSDYQLIVQRYIRLNREIKKLTQTFKKQNLSELQDDDRGIFDEQNLEEFIFSALASKIKDPEDKERG
jgi:hypothetical protein